MVSVCLPSISLLHHLPSYLNFSYLGRGVSLHSCSSKAQLLLLTLDEGYLLSPPFLTFNVGLPLQAAAPGLGHRVAALGRCPGLWRGVAPSCCRPWPRAPPLASDAGWLLSTAAPDLRCGVALLGCPSHACGATQDGRVMVERSDRMWSTGEGNGKPLHYSCLENPINSMKGKMIGY